MGASASRAAGTRSPRPINVTYTIEITSSARKEIRRLDPQIRSQVEAVISGLAQQPRPNGVKKLSGRQHTYRVPAANDWRVVYEVHDDIVTVDVIQIENRGQVYKNKR